MKTNSTLKKEFYFNLLSYFLLFCGSMAIPAWLVIGEIKTWTSSFSFLTLIFSLISASVLLACSIYSIVQMIPYFKDLPSVKNNRYDVVEGTVVGLKKNTYLKADFAIHCFPILQMKDSGKIIIVNTSDTLKVGQTYLLQILPNCKVAKAICELPQE